MRAPLRLLWGLLAITLGVVAVTAWLPVPPLPAAGAAPGPARREPPAPRPPGRDHRRRGARRGHRRGPER